VLLTGDGEGVTGERSVRLAAEWIGRAVVGRTVATMPTGAAEHAVKITAGATAATQRPREPKIIAASLRAGCAAAVEQRPVDMPC
jgi:hypothetical protein